MARDGTSSILHALPTPSISPCLFFSLPRTKGMTSHGRKEKAVQKITGSLIITSSAIAERGSSSAISIRLEGNALSRSALSFFSIMIRAAAEVVE